MSEKDRLLIKQAFEFFDGSDWNQIEKLEAQAESDEAKQILHDRKVHLYRKEEAFAGIS
jgi:hypothetical protein